MTLAYLQKEFPKTRTNAALTGVIPMAYFEQHERLIRAIITEFDLRLYYRGKRIGSAQNTRRKDAYGIVLYNKPKAYDSVEPKHKSKYATRLFLGMMLGAFFAVAFEYLVPPVTNCIQQSHNTTVDALVYECMLHYQGE